VVAYAIGRAAFGHWRFGVYAAMLALIGVIFWAYLVATHCCGS
jgi:hypothetical protein